MQFIPSSLSLASCFVRFPSIGILKVRGIFCVIGVCILRIHDTAWNTGTCMYMAWTGIGCLIQCINSIVWNKNMIDRAPVYCDIGELIYAFFRVHLLTIYYHTLRTVTHFQIGLNVAIPACSLCINRRLFKITRGTVVMVTRSEKRRAVIVDLLICIVPSILQMIVREFFLVIFFPNWLFTWFRRRVYCIV